MKNSTVVMSLLLTSTAAFAEPRNSSPVVLAPVPVSHVYSPQGFDSNDNVEVVLKGYLPNLCYRSPSALPKVKDQSIQIQAVAYRPTGHVECAQVAIPFLETAQVGVLDKGDYGISVNPGESNSRSSSIHIAEATSSAIDDFVYANISSVERVPGTRTVMLKGTNPVNCFDLDQIKYISNGKDSYSVLPIMKQVSANCETKPVAFNYMWEVPTELSATEPAPLLHVRIMNGKSVNEVFNELE